MLSMKDSLKMTATRVPHLGEVAFPRGNSYKGVHITQSDASKLRGKGRLKKIEGLLYDVNFDGFDPFDSSIWPYRIERSVNDARMELMTETFHEVDVNASHTLTVHRTPMKRSKHILRTCTDIANSHNGVRGTGWGGVGGMYSAGYNLGYKGRLSRVAPSCKMKNMPPSFLRSIQNGLSSAGNRFDEEFSHRHAGYKETLVIQDEMWVPHQKVPIGPACWIVSIDLGNPLHTDDDHSRSYAGWFCAEEIQNRSAWFLFPEWGVAIELCNNTWISWDGRNCAHCSSVPHLSESNHLYSLFTAITRKVYAQITKVNQFQLTVSERRSNGAECVGDLYADVDISSLRVGDKVTFTWVAPYEIKNFKPTRRSIRKYQGHDYRRWSHCVVDAISMDHRTIDLRDRCNKGRVHKNVTNRIIHNRMIIGWV